MKSAKNLVLLLGLVCFVGPCIIAITSDQSEPPGPRRTATPRSTGSAPTGSPEERARGIVYAKTTANIRSGPSTSHRVVRSAKAGQALAFTTKQGSWYKLYQARAAAKSEEWIHESVVRTF